LSQREGRQAAEEPPADRDSGRAIERSALLITRLMTVEAFTATRVARCRYVCGVTDPKTPWGRRDPPGWGVNEARLGVNKRLVNAARRLSQ